MQVRLRPDQVAGQTCHKRCSSTQLPWRIILQQHKEEIALASVMLGVPTLSMLILGPHKWSAAQSPSQPLLFQVLVTTMSRKHDPFLVCCMTQRKPLRAHCCCAMLQCRPHPHLRHNRRRHPLNQGRKCSRNSFRTPQVKHATTQLTRLNTLAACQVVALLPEYAWWFLSPMLQFLHVRSGHPSGYYGFPAVAFSNFRSTETGQICCELLGL